MSLTVEQRIAIVKEAHSWLCTPYKGHSCFKGARGGVDCGQLLYGIYHNCGHVPEIKLPTDYSLQVSMHQESTEYIDLVSRFFRLIPESEVLPGDVVVYKFGYAYAHAAIIIDWPTHVIHSFGRHGVSGAHGKKTPKFHRANRLFFTVKDSYC